VGLPADSKRCRHHPPPRPICRSQACHARGVPVSLAGREQRAAACHQVRHAGRTRLLCPDRRALRYALRWWGGGRPAQRAVGGGHAAAACDRGAQAQRHRRRRRHPGVRWHNAPVLHAACGGAVPVDEHAGQSVCSRPRRRRLWLARRVGRLAGGAAAASASVPQDTAAGGWPIRPALACRRRQHQWTWELEQRGGEIAAPPAICKRVCGRRVASRMSGFDTDAETTDAPASSSPTAAVAGRGELGTFKASPSAGVGAFQLDSGSSSSSGSGSGSGAGTVSRPRISPGAGASPPALPPLAIGGPHPPAPSCAPPVHRPISLAVGRWRRCPSLPTSALRS